MADEEYRYRTGADHRHWDYERQHEEHRRRGAGQDTAISEIQQRLAAMRATAAVERWLMPLLVGIMSAIITLAVKGGV